MGAVPLPLGWLPAQAGASATLFPTWGAPAYALLLWETCKYFSFFFVLNMKFKASTGLLCSLGGDVVAVVLCRWHFALADAQLFE